MSLSMTSSVVSVAHREDKESDHLELNSRLGITLADGRIPLEVDAQAARAYFLNDVNVRCRFFHNLDEKLNYLIREGYYSEKVFQAFDFAFTKSLYKRAYGYNFRFKSFMGAHKFYKGYAMKTKDNKSYLERFEDRVVANAIHLSRGNRRLAENLVDEIMSRRYQPATPTFLNAGTHNRGEMVSCFLINLSDTMESIARHIGSVKMLSKRGGGVAACLTNLRALGDPIKGVEDRASGVVPVAKAIDGGAAYANQLGARDGAAAVYIHMCHLDTPALLDTKRENADDAVRIKTLSIGVVVPDIAYKLAAQDKDIYLFSSYDIAKEYGKEMTEISINDEYHRLVANPKIRKKKLNARKYFQTISYIQGQSGYPFIMNEDHVNRANPLPGRICMSNLCTEILQPSVQSTYLPDMSYDHVGKDISCNLGSLNVLECFEAGRAFSKTVDTSIRALSAVSDLSNIDCVPSIDNGNKRGHAVGLGAMNLHGFFGHNRVHYDSPEAIELTDLFFATVRYWAIKTSCRIAQETGETFETFKESKYYTGEVFEPYIARDWSDIKHAKTRELLNKFHFSIPNAADWQTLADDVKLYGMYNQNLLAIAPTGSISYVNNATASIHPIVSRVEARKEGALGRVYYPASMMTNENIEYYKTAYEYGWKAQIDIYVAASKHIDQGCSLTLFMPENATTRDFDQARIYAWLMGIKTLYYIRTEEVDEDAPRQKISECEACAV